MLTCPKTSRDYSTGVFVEKDALGRLPNALLASRCPHCGRAHHCRQYEARYVDEIPQTDISRSAVDRADEINAELVKFFA
jgi:hypothetical protein